MAHNQDEWLRKYGLLGTGRAWEVNPVIPAGIFCEHGIYLGDANPNRPCPKCAEK